jgi:hypothetical protein
MSIKANIVGGSTLTGAINKPDTVKVEGVRLGSVTKEQVGLGNVNNTNDADKPVSTATQAALDNITTGGTLNSPTVSGGKFNFGTFNSPTLVGKVVVESKATPTGILGGAIALKTPGTDPQPDLK